MPATATPAERVELKSGPPPAAPAGSGGRNWSTRRIERTIKYESDRNVGFGRDVMRVPGCEQLENCIQCGTCSGVCPLSIYMDHSPRQVMALTRADFRDEVLRSHTIWLCASCYACTVECPQQIRITDIMYELKQRAIDAGIYPRRFPIPVLAHEFTHMVRKHGRITELVLVIRLFLKTDWFAALGNWRLGLDLTRTGRFSLLTERIRRHGDIARMLDAVDQPKHPSP
ncbi:MAG: 4Fe-4S dicluster domain-containing protein [Opitutaceae bacterium]|nr:4Fe-4S dicluster domain-containing protein [Opitutaceae bacterium]